MSRDRSLSARVPTDKLPDANHLKVSVSYDEGGINYFTYKTDPRGYVATVTPVEVEVGEYFVSEAISGLVTNPLNFRVFLEPATRFNRKTLEKIAAKVLPMTESFIELLAAGNRASVARLLKIAAANALGKEVVNHGEAGEAA